jgi:hypothetical protein
MIVLHYRAIPDLHRQVQQAIAASARATRQPPPARRPLHGSGHPARARQAARPTRPRSLSPPRRRLPPHRTSRPNCQMTARRIAPAHLGIGDRVAAHQGAW